MSTELLAATLPILGELSFAGVATTVTAFGVILGGMYVVYRMMRRVEGAIGIDKQGRSIADRMDRVEHQLWPNGGSSLADKVNSMGNSMNELDACSRETSAKVELIREMLVAIIESERKHR
jgi:hypothetical protein